MANYSMNDPEYWAAPEKFAPLVEASALGGARATFRLLGPDEEATPTIAVLEMPPGCVISRHAHDCERFEVIVKGSIDVGDRVLHAGDVMVAAPGEFYGPKVVGPDGCTTVEVFSNQRGVVAPILHELNDGTQIGVDYLAGQRRPDDIAGMEGIAERVAAVLAVVEARDS